MWVNHALKFCYVAVPHTGCTSVITWLRKNYPPTERVGKKHDAVVLPDTEDYLYWTVYRDESERLEAMWRKHFLDPNEHLSAAVCRPGGEVFEHYGDWLKARQEHMTPMLEDQEDFLRPLTRIRSPLPVFQFEELPRCLAYLPFVTEIGDFPHHNRREP